MQLYVHWMHLLNTRTCRYSYITPAVTYCDQDRCVMNLFNLEMDSAVFKSGVFLTIFRHKLLFSCHPTESEGDYRNDPRPSVCASVRLSVRLSIRHSVPPSFRPSDLVPATPLTSFIGLIRNYIDCLFMV